MCWFKRYVGNFRMTKPFTHTTQPRSKGSTWNMNRRQFSLVLMCIHPKPYAILMFVYIEYAVQNWVRRLDIQSSENQKHIKLAAWIAHIFCTSFWSAAFFIESGKFWFSQKLTYSSTQCKVKPPSRYELRSCVAYKTFFWKFLNWQMTTRQIVWIS